MLKRMKDMKDMVNAAPAMVQQAQQLGAQAQQMAAAHQAAAQAQFAQAQGQMGQFGGTQAAVEATGADFDPVAGVTLEQFAAVSKGVAAYNYDGSKLVEIAAGFGISAQSWADASLGWNSRVQSNPAVAQRFNQLYRES
jgi:hypothetical protein